jgi:competence protein ComEC
LSDRQIVATAAVALIVAWIHPAVPPWSVAALVVAAGVFRRPAVVAVAVVALVALLACWAMAGLHAARAGPVEGVAELWGDPAPRPGGEAVDVRLSGSHWALEASGAAAAVIAERAAGDRIEVTGRTTPFTRPEDWAIARHLEGTLVATEVRAVGRGAVPFRIANSVRGLLARGRASLEGDRGALFDGIVIGDDRFQSALMSFEFRASGLGHLLAVSGQNVAFMLVAVRPLVKRLTLRWRWAALLVTLALFAVVTRWEPSVMRAVAMAAVVATAGLLGRYTSSIRVVAVAVVVLLLIDPLIVRSFGFQLSLAATVALVVLARPIARRLPGPRWLAEALGVVLAAHLGTAPLLLAVGNRMSIASLPANLLAVPVAGWLMVWGLTGGLAAGLVGGPLAAVLQLPSQAMLWWIDTVASLAARPAMPRLGWSATAALVLTVAIVVVMRGRWRWLALAPGVLMVGALGATGRSGTIDIDPGTFLARSGPDAVLVLSGRGDEGQVLDVIGSEGCPALVLVTSGTSRPAGVVWSMRRICGGVRVVAPDPTVVRGAEPARAGVVRVGSLALDVTEVDGRWSARPLGGATPEGQSSTTNAAPPRR